MPSERDVQDWFIPLVKTRVTVGESLFSLSGVLLARHLEGIQRCIL
jgi:hypothetical protein